jgi:putative membrane protein
MKLVRAGLFVLGALLLGLLVVYNEPAEIFSAIGRLSWRLGLLVTFPFVLVALLDTLGWRYAFRTDRVGFGTLLWVRLAGEAVNMATPTAAVGGEVVKAWLLRRHLPVDEGISSVIVAKTTITIAQGLFLLVGIVLAWLTVLPTGLVQGMLWLLALEVVALTGFVLAQTRGMTGSITWLLRRIRVPSGRLGAALTRVDEGLAMFYAREPGRLLLSIAFHFVAWMLGILEAYLMLRFLGVDVSLATAGVIEAFGTAIRFATFLIPASLGVLEGGYVATFGALGLGTTAGVAFALTRRVREITWIVVGLAVLTVARSTPAVEKDSSGCETWGAAKGPPIPPRSEASRRSRDVPR